MRRNKVVTILIMVLVLHSLLSLPLIAKVQDSYLNNPLVRVKDITRIQGVRDNQLLGYGLVVGLSGSGDSSSSEATVRSIANMLKKFGVNVNSNQVESENIAAVMVTAELPPFSRPGDRVDLNVSSIGDAESLQGGTLLMTPLTGPNQKEVYAMGQGPISIGGFNASQGGNSVRKNHTTVGMIPNGGIIEREVRTDFMNKGEITLLLDNPDFATAQRIAEAVNQRYGYNSDGNNFAQALDPGRVEVTVPSYFKDRSVSFIAEINKLPVRPDTEAKVVINERTGTIVMGHNVRISTISVAHGNLTITISTQEEVDQPPPLSEGETEKTQNTDVSAKEEKSNLLVVPKGSTISDVVKALNGVGATPRDTIAILQAIKQAGALHAKLEIM
ncbi:flagellar basal body P-ring protein FlgI [Selenihalanaerobacter shriftii]|uniref:Flagellar P-ring protein n=1 Tax=Selenihalanaerobacter shriftii TaxID=142842 RepID=A0A1T4KZ60_9FIRM|nr:flagellar basal body P-ring protein FlgI [Selenihalanaerobacter shriftii]SJZ47719.1 flagellar P-ring protein precursor FlgI [Selenihalanaerobacter shriftii]